MVDHVCGNMIIYKDETFNFYEIFNEENGTLIRSDVNGIDPVMRSFPELLDVGVMGHCDSGNYCKNAGVDCYQRGSTECTSHMSVKNFESIARQASGKVFQIALGGAGDPNKHPQFKDILEICRKYRIVPNLTTSGFLLTDNEIELIEKYCGAVAVSWYSRLVNGEENNLNTIQAIENFVNAGCVTNIHYVISKDTIDEAITRMEQNLFPNIINAIIFILYKPIGDGVIEKVLKNNDDRLDKFFELVIEKKHPYQIGFDTCFTPALLKYTDKISPISIDACEAATFSMYIDSQMNCFPCSFGCWNENVSESLSNKTLKEIWVGERFTSFRKREKEKCINCKEKRLCQNGCRLGIDIDLC